MQRGHWTTRWLVICAGVWSAAYFYPVRAQAQESCGQLQSALVGDGQTVGQVDIRHDAETLYIDLYAHDAEGWGIVESHVHVGRSLADFPLNRRDLPRVARFRYSHDYRRLVAVDSYRIPLASLGLGGGSGSCLGENVLVAVHADAVRRGRDRDPVCRGRQNVSAWAGDLPFSPCGDARLVEYELGCCSDDPCPGVAAAFESWCAQREELAEAPCDLLAGLALDHCSTRVAGAPPDEVLAACEDTEHLLDPCLELTGGDWGACWVASRGYVGECLQAFYEDPYEPNDDFASAVSLGPIGSAIACIDAPSDVDVFALDVPWEADLYASAWNYYATSSIGLTLYADGPEPQPIAGAEHVLEVGALPAGRYWLELRADSPVCYSLFYIAPRMRFQELEPNDDFATATPIDGLESERYGDACLEPAGDVDVFAFEVEGRSQLQVWGFDHMEQPVSLSLHAGAEAMWVADGEGVLTAVVEPGLHYLTVTGEEPGCYSLSLLLTPTLESPTIISFVVDDSANGTYEEGQLQWKGSFSYDAETNTIVNDWSWSGPYVPLYDDGPFSAGGHEAEGQTAGDHVWSTEVFFWASPFGDSYFEYGLIDETGGWIWRGPNGALFVPAGEQGRLEAEGQAIPAWGEVDFVVALDTAALSPDFGWFDAAEGAVEIKGSFNAWQLVTLEGGEDGVFYFVWSEHLGPHDGLVSEGDEIQFIFMLDGVEYKLDGIASLDGVQAWSDAETPGVFEQEETYIRYGRFANTAFLVGPE